MQLVHKKGWIQVAVSCSTRHRQANATHTRPSPFKGRLDRTSVSSLVCPGSELQIAPSHPLRQLILPSEVNPRVLARQEQLHPHIEDADHLQGREVVDLLGVVNR